MKPLEIKAAQRLGTALLKQKRELGRDKQQHSKTKED